MAISIGPLGHNGDKGLLLYEEDMQRHEAFQAEKPMITGFQKYSERKKSKCSASVGHELGWTGNLTL